MRRLPVLLVGCCLMVGCGGDPRPVPLVAGVVDSFEDGDGINALGHPWESVSSGEGVRASVSVDPGGFPSDSEGYLVVRGVRPDRPVGSEVSGARSRLTQLPAAADPARDERPRDVSGFGGLSLALRGTPGTYIVQIGTASVQDFDFFNAYVEVGPEWSRYELPFAAFKQEGFGKVQPWTGADVIHVAVYANLPGYFEFGIDDVRFH